MEEKNRGSFIWGADKELSNIQKHGIDFITASKAFKDPQRKSISTPNILRKKKGFSA